LDWINDELHTERIIVQDIEEDLYDGQVMKQCFGFSNLMFDCPFKGSSKTP